jgi:2-C-methyl-D-erythritol 4-phosphate cytidylyltransferase
MAVALIVAGGKGLRMNMKARKQYLELDGQTVLQRTLSAFNQCEDIESIVLVVPPEDIDYCHKDVIGTLELAKKVQVAGGGDERQQSVYNGLCSMNVSPDEVVVIHDGVRPFIEKELIQSCIDAAKETGAAILAVPVSDTIKMAAHDGTIETTVDRECLWAAQTPQAFRYDWIRQAHETALTDKIAVTDDASLVEHIGYPVKLVTGSRRNIKITTPEDLAIASALIQG